jgi:PAS domain S-box-containing protein
MDDVTERRRAEEALQDSEVRFRSLIHNSTDIIRILDGDGRIIFDSPSSERILGYPTGYTLGKSPFDFIHPDDREKVSRDLDTVYNKKNNAIPTEYRMRKADGEYLEVESLGMNMIGVLGVDGIVINTRPIAERKRAEEALRESEANLKMAEKIACLGQWDIDMATGEGHWSDGTYRLLGYRPGEIETGGDAWMARIHPDDRSYVEDCKRAALQNKQSLAYDYRIVLPDGEVRWIHDESNAPVLDAAGRPVKVFGTVQDITERKLTEKQLAETARFLKAALRASPLAITAIDRNMNVILWNKMAENVFGWTEEEVLGKPLPTVPEDLKDEGDKLHALVNSGESLHGIATRRRRKDGAVIDLTIDASPLYDENGKLLGALGVFQELKP